MNHKELWELCDLEIEKAKLRWKEELEKQKPTELNAIRRELFDSILESGIQIGRQRVYSELKKTIEKEGFCYG